ncbi:hypothetical protein BCR32DRAFT_324431 [Anaeromyces robustus]|uniref:Uncharacterized protein n=1 Tax=Anaeromyces robustus TaxID=1754192 RepID=A0A1Y1XNX2_9FUNG|nr:hypothetical protein BCR32DRAFT_324431 [Anaeromyces robustus]|eukprot:ORX87449.1 hypothetical protein BCR32DRAFT_324431 [Anaeromyces robustus]
MSENSELLTDTNSSTLYEDKYVKITNTHISLKKYYFPSFTSKNIAFTDIEKICTDKEFGVNTLGYKSWGMGLSSIYWAWGGVPRSKNNYIIKIKNSSPNCGFSVENPDEFCKVLESKGVMKVNKKSS